MPNKYFEIHEFVECNRPGKIGLIGWVADYQLFNDKFYYSIYFVTNHKQEDCSRFKPVWIQENELERLSSKAKKNLMQFQAKEENQIQLNSEL